MPPISNSYEIVCMSLYFSVSLQGSLLSLITFLQQFGVLSRFFASRRRTGKGRVIKENRDNICPKITKRPVFIAPAVLPVDMKKPRKHWVYAGFFWRRGRDSNPRGIAPKLISSLLCNCDGGARFGVVSVSLVPAESRLKSGFFARKALRDGLF